MAAGRRVGIWVAWWTSVGLAVSPAGPSQSVLGAGASGVPAEGSVADLARAASADRLAATGGAHLVADATRGAAAATAGGAMDVVMRNLIIVIAVGAVTALVVGAAFMYLLYRTGLGSVFSRATGVPDVRSSLPPDALKAAQLDGVKDVGTESDGGGEAGVGGEGAGVETGKRSWLPGWMRRKG